MKAIMVMFDSLNRHMLPPYGCDWVHAPNFQRLADRSLTFDRSYICSMPCMPARRDLHTGRPNFLHRSWGPLEPFDDSVPRLLRDNGISSHLISDHQHYWEAGGATYHTQYSTWQFHRGQEGDPWMGQVADPPELNAHGRNALNTGLERQDRINRQFIKREADQPQTRTFAAGLDFIKRNHTEDNWFLQIETFDPHEPFFNQSDYREHYKDLMGDRTAPLFDWPSYSKVTESSELMAQCRGHYAALVSMCDARLGEVLDEMDRLNLWQDTMLLVWTDHGFLLGEHDWWAKHRTPWYQELANTPFFIWDPRGGQRGERRQSLVQPSIDLGPTLLDFFGLESTPDMLGKNLCEAIATDAEVRDAAIFGIHGGHVNLTDGCYVYMRAPAGVENEPLFDYTLMPTRIREMFKPEDLREIEMVSSFSFSKDCSLMKIRRPSFEEIPHDSGGKRSVGPEHLFENLLFDIESDPGQLQPIDDSSIEAKLSARLVELMKECDAPKEQFQRLGL